MTNLSKKSISQKKKGVSVDELFFFLDKLQKKSKKDTGLKKVFETAAEKWDSPVAYPYYCN